MFSRSIGIDIKPSLTATASTGVASRRKSRRKMVVWTARDPLSRRGLQLSLALCTAALYLPILFALLPRPLCCLPTMMISLDAIQHGDQPHKNKSRHGQRTPPPAWPLTRHHRMLLRLFRNVRMAATFSEVALTKTAAITTTAHIKPSACPDVPFSWQESPSDSLGLFSHEHVRSSTPRHSQLDSPGPTQAVLPPVPLVKTTAVLAERC
jgi:hypothetical protein